MERVHPAGTHALVCVTCPGGEQLELPCTGAAAGRGAGLGLSPQELSATHRGVYVPGCGSRCLMK